MRTSSSIQSDVDDSAGGELKAACELVVRELVDGVQHGFFKMTVTVATVQAKKKEITVEAGKSNRFIV